MLPLSCPGDKTIEMPPVIRVMGLFLVFIGLPFCFIDSKMKNDKYKKEMQIEERRQFSFYIKDTGKTNVTFEEWKATRK
jgi:hypothetical protein